MEKGQCIMMSKRTAPNLMRCSNIPEVNARSLSSLRKARSRWAMEDPEAYKCPSVMG